MKWSEDLKKEIAHKINLAPHGKKKAIAEMEAKKIKKPNPKPSAKNHVSVATIYRRVKPYLDSEKKAPREPDIPESMINLVGRVKVEPAMYGRHKRFLNTDDAIDLLEQSGMVEPGLLKQSTVDRRLRQAGFNQKRSYTRHEDDYANQVHLMDSSVSEYLTHGGIDEDGNHFAIVDGSQGNWSYKNKDRPTSERFKLWAVSYLDTYSRAWCVRYFASPGESINMGVDMLEFMWQRQDSDHPFSHLPLETFSMDQGPLAHSNAFERGLGFLGIDVIPAGSKSDRLKARQSTGKVENRFRTLWKKEMAWVMTLKKRGVKTITLDNLNTLVHQFCTQRMQRKHPTRAHSIEQVYRTGLLAHEQRRIPRDFDLRMLFFSEDTRKVSPLNEITISNQLYKVPEGYRDQKIYYVKFPDGRMKGMSPDRRQTFDLIAFEAAEATGSRGHTPTYKELLHERGPVDLDGNRLSLTSETEQKDMPENVHSMPAREKETAPETPFNAEPRQDVFEDWDEARLYICESFGCSWNLLQDSAKEMFKEFFEMKKLSKQAIDDIAQSAS